MTVYDIYDFYIQKQLAQAVFYIFTAAKKYYYHFSNRMYLPAEQTIKLVSSYAKLNEQANIFIFGGAVTTDQETIQNFFSYN